MTKQKTVEQLEQLVAHWKAEARRVKLIADKERSKSSRDSIMAQSVRYWMCASELEDVLKADHAVAIERSQTQQLQTDRNWLREAFSVGLQALRAVDCDLTCDAETRKQVKNAIAEMEAAQTARYWESLAVHVPNGGSDPRSVPQTGLPQGDRNWTVESIALAGADEWNEGYDAGFAAAELKHTNPEEFSRQAQDIKRRILAAATLPSTPRPCPSPGLIVSASLERNWTVESGALATNSLPEALREIEKARE
jgi:hypothetical protein